MKSIRTSGKSVGKSRDAGIAQFTGEDDEVISLSPSYLLESPSFDDGMMEIQLQKRLQIFLLKKICQSKTHGQNRLVCVILFIDKKISCAFDRKFN